MADWLVMAFRYRFIKLIRLYFLTLFVTDEEKH